MSLCMGFRALSFLRLAKALTVSQPVKACSPISLQSPGQFADLDKSCAVLCPTLLIDGTLDILLESKTKQHDIGVFGCDYDCLQQVLAACSAYKHVSSHVT